LAETVIKAAEADNEFFDRILFPVLAGEE